MAYTTAGLTNGGVTTHYKFSYDSALGGPGGVEPARTNAVIAACEGDYNLMKGWFGGGVSVTGMSVEVTTQSNGASWSGSASSSTIQLKAQGASYSNNPAYLRYLIIAEVVEIFMMAQNIGWFQGSNEGSKGEGLSRFLSGQFLALNGFLGVGMDADYAVADLWLNSSRQDFVNNAPDDNGYDATNGCTTLFIYYLFTQLGYSINQIVAAGSSTLAGVYKNLTGDSSNPFPLFSSILALWYPSETSSAVPGPNLDNPWPLVAISYTGVWRAGTGPYYLWVNADQSSFMTKWQQLAAQNLRLVDIEVSTMPNGQVLWSGIWEPGTDAYYLWVDADTSHFVAKWQQLAAQNLRLVSFAHYKGLWAGVWRSGTDGYYLWVDANESSFTTKWQQLASQNLRLVDFEVYDENGQRLWAGIWRSGSDAYYLWINADWPSFQAKWQQLAAQNLRLVGVRNYAGLWAGIWRSGTDAYYLWANVSEASFLSKWSELAGQNLRLVDMDAVPLGVTGASGAVGAGSATEMFGVSDLAGAGVQQVGRVMTATTVGSGSSTGAVGMGGRKASVAGGSGKGGGQGATLTAAEGSVGTGGGSVSVSPASGAGSTLTGAGLGGGSDAGGSAAEGSAGTGGGSVSVSSAPGGSSLAGAGKGGGGDANFVADAGGVAGIGDSAYPTSAPAPSPSAPVRTATSEMSGRVGRQNG